MAAQRSNLSGAAYGYDFVLATTQKSINATMKAYLKGLSSTPTKVYYINEVVDEETAETRTKQITRDELLTITKGFDPLTLTDSVRSNDPRAKSIASSGFAAAFEVEFGIPPQYTDPAVVPDIVKLSADTRNVDFTMLCKTFKVVDTTSKIIGNRVFTDINVASQSTDKEGKPFIIKANVDLRIKNYLGEHKDLPEPVRNAIKNLSDTAFSIQQLLFDLNNAGLQSAIRIDGITPEGVAGTKIQGWFINTYMAAMKTKGEPVLNYTVKQSPQTATLKPTDLNFMTQPFLDVNTLKAIESPSKEQNDLYTLNYLCAVEGHTLPNPTQFNWNWVNSEDSKQFDGIISIKRETFANWFLGQILPLAKKECFTPGVRVTVKPFGEVGCEYNAFTNEDNVDITVTRSNAPNSQVITLAWYKDAYDCAGVDGALGSLKFINQYDATIKFEGNNIKVHIDGRIHLDLKIGQTWNTGDVSRQVYDDVYTLNVNAAGKIEIVHTSDKKDLSQDDSVNWLSDLFTDANAWFSYLKSRKFTSRQFQNFPISAIQDFVFPGGRDFTFKELRFSDNQDLICAITYTDPVGR